MNISYKVSSKNWIAFVCMVFGMFMAVLDIQIVASSIKEIQAGLSATQDEINWVQSSYLIAEVMIIPLCGWLVKAFSTRILFSVSCAMFTLMSVACAFSWNLNSMILFRALQGFFGGAMIPTVFATIYTIFPIRLRPMVTVVIGLVVTMAPISGPVIGGYITNYLSWHYLFLLNIFPGIAVVIATLKLVDFDKPHFELIKDIDFIGMFLIMLSLGSLQYILEEGNREEWLDSSLIVSLSFISAISGILMIYREWTIKNPIINLHAFKDRNFVSGCIFSFILGWGLYTVVFLVPIYLGTVRGLNSLQIGEYVFIQGLFQFLSAPVAGILSKKIDLRIMLAMGMFLFGVGCWSDAYLTNQSDFDYFFLPQAIRGFSLMFCFVPITTLTFATLKQDQIQTASGLYNLMRNLGGAIGLAITNNWLQTWVKDKYLNLRSNIDETNQLAIEALENFNAMFEGFNYQEPKLAALKLLYNFAQREAFIITFNQIFIVMAVLFIISVVLTVFIDKVNLDKQAQDTH